MDLGIIGKARSGKTSLFNAVTRGTAQVGAYSAADRPNVGVVDVPDERVDRLTEVFHPKKKTYARIRFVDFPGGDFGAEGPGQAFLTELSNLDALVQVVRAFEDASVPHDGPVDPARDIEALGLELTFADLALVERRLERIEREVRTKKASERARQERDRDLLVRMRAHLEDGRALRTFEVSAEDEPELRKYQLVTRLPMLIVLNVGEDDLARAGETEAGIRERFGAHDRGVAVASVCARLEAELAQMSPEDAAAFRRDLDLPEHGPLARAIVAAYDLLGLISFLTVGEDECRAWTVRRGATAPEAAGTIHSDLQRGFIRAEVADWRDTVEAGSLSELRRRGKLRTEGKGYVVQDGDVLNVLFNV